jgi:glycosyltransferase involved in cell wall biosynthesis
MIILTTFYNAENYIEKCVGSIFGQNFKDFKCYLIDDLSTDSSVSKINNMIGGDERFKLIVNIEKKYKTLNYVEVLNNLPEIDDNEIVVEIDGDDWLPNSKVFSNINKTYEDNNIWITNGSFRYASGPIGFSSNQINFNNLRNDRFTASHLRTWRVFLWRNIKDADHKDSDGNYLKVNADLAYMLPMLEMAGPEHYKFISDINLIYNDENPLNDHKVDMRLVNSLANEIRSRKQYEKLKL